MILAYEEALWSKKLEINHASQILKPIVRFWFFLSYLINTVTGQTNCSGLKEGQGTVNPNNLKSLRKLYFVSKIVLTYFEYLQKF